MLFEKEKSNGKQMNCKTYRRKKNASIHFRWEILQKAVANTKDTVERNEILFCISPSKNR